MAQIANLNPRRFKIGNWQLEIVKCLMVSQELLDMLVCPACHKPLQLKDNGQSLKCAECRRVFPIKDDIPVMLLDEASIDPS